MGGPKVDAASLRRFLEAIARPRAPFADRAAHAETAAFVRRSFEGWGYRVEEDPFSCNGERFFNLLAERPGASDEPFLVGAHFDAVEGSPGADDNASGMSVLLETARLLAGHPASAKLRFAAFDLEEWGMLGSAHYVSRLRSEGKRVRGMVSLEMLGFTGPKQAYPAGLGLFYPARGNFIGVAANWGSRGLMKKFADGMRRVERLPVETIAVPGDGGLVPAIRLSDQAPFWDAGLPALMVTDTAFFRNPNYHTANDTVETLDMEFFAAVAQGVVEGVLNAVSD